MAKDIQLQILEQLEDITIALLAQNGVGQREIKKVVGVGSERVGRIAGLIKPKGQK